MDNPIQRWTVQSTLTATKKCDSFELPGSISVCLFEFLPVATIAPLRVPRRDCRNMFLIFSSLNQRFSPIFVVFVAVVLLLFLLLLLLLCTVDVVVADVADIAVGAFLLLLFAQL